LETLRYKIAAYDEDLPDDEDEEGVFWLDSSNKMDVRGSGALDQQPLHLD